MTNNELIRHVASKTGTNKIVVERVLEGLTNTIAENMIKGEKTNVLDLGVFYLGSREARRGVNPKTGEWIQIPKMRMPGFRAGVWLKRKIRQDD